MDQYTQSQVSQFKEAFSILDVDKKGRIGSKELMSQFERMGRKVSEAEIEEIIKPFDVEAKNSLDFQQFLNLMKQGAFYDKDQEIKEAFDLFDVSEKGAITTKDIHSGLVKLGENMSMKDVQDIVDEIGDGKKVFFEQFKEMMD
ncbi:hypothetical protein MHBO_002991 [Bonamia ostreae]|uniref:Calmodulin n=1 Tax=Bonamia ostreae TaxID=126728 RepID=A0ABV2AQ42_9EUKA